MRIDYAHLRTHSNFLFSAFVSGTKKQETVNQTKIFYVYGIGATLIWLGRFGKNPLPNLSEAKSGPFCFVFEHSSEKTFFASFCYVCQKFRVSFVSLQRNLFSLFKRKNTFFLRKKKVAKFFRFASKQSFRVISLHTFSIQNNKIRFKRK